MGKLRSWLVWVWAGVMVNDMISGKLASRVEVPYTYNLSGSHNNMPPF